MKNVKRKKYRVILSVLLSMLIFSASSINSKAAEGTSVTRERTFRISSTDTETLEEKAAFDTEIVVDGSKYTLKDIVYETLSETYLDKKEKVVKSDPMDADISFVPEQSITENGVEYLLVKTEKKELVSREASTQYVSAFDEYQYAISVYDVPATKTVNVLNEATGQYEDVECKFQDITSAGTTSVTTYLMINYEKYDSSWYEWEGYVIPRNDDVPALFGYEDQLLACAGTSASAGSRVTELAWSGDPYLNGEGVLCRDAVASIVQPVSIYRANYQGIIRTEEEKNVIYESTYEGADPTGSVEYEVKAIAEYQKKQSYTKVVLCLTGIGIVVLAGGITVLLLKLSKKQKEGK